MKVEKRVVKLAWLYSSKMSYIRLAASDIHGKP